MKRFLQTLGAFVLLQLAVLLAVVTLCPRDSSHYLAATVDKHARLAAAARPRLILVGGSNVSWGFDSAQLQRALGLEPVNMGLTMWVGLDFMLNEVERDLEPGDVVVVSLEYDLLLNDLADDTILSLLEQRPASVRFIDVRQARLLLEQGLPNLTRKIECALSRLGDGAKNPPLYARESFDAYGDFVAHRGQSRPGTPIPARVLPVPAAGLDLERPIARLNQLAAECRGRGAHCFFSYPPIPEGTLERNRDLIDQVDRELEAGLDLSVLHRPADTCYPADQFFDTGYHPIAETIERRTALLADALRAALAGR